MPTLISAFAVPPQSDDAFLRWSDGPGVLFRALRGDVALRFVRVSEDRAVPAAPAPFPAHAALYEVVHQDGEPEGAGGTVLITPLEVPAGGDDEFVAHWQRLRALLADRQGYLGSRLYRATGPADFRFVAVTRWSSPLMYARTLQQPAVAEAIAAQPFRGEPALYLALGTSR